MRQNRPILVPRNATAVEPVQSPSPVSTAGVVAAVFEVPGDTHLQAQAYEPFVTASAKQILWTLGVAIRAAGGPASPWRQESWNLPKGTLKEEPTRYLAITGGVAEKDRELSKGTVAKMKAQFMRAVETLFQSPSDDVTVAGNGFDLRLRLFEKAATANEWTGLTVRSAQTVVPKAVPQNLSDLFAALRLAIQNSFGVLPKDYAARATMLNEAFDTTRIEFAKVLEPALNAHAKTLPQQTYEDKKTLAKWINAELRRFGLAISVHGTDKPCLLTANTGGRPGIGRFALYYTDDSGKRHDVLSPSTLPELRLTLDEMTRSPYGGRTRNKSR